MTSRPGTEMLRIKSQMPQAISLIQVPGISAGEVKAAMEQAPMIYPEEVSPQEQAEQNQNLQKQIHEITQDIKEVKKTTVGPSGNSDGTAERSGSGSHPTGTGDGEGERCFYFDPQTGTAGSGDSGGCKPRADDQSGISKNRRKTKNRTGKEGITLNEFH